MGCNYVDKNLFGYSSNELDNDFDTVFFQYWRSLMIYNHVKIVFYLDFNNLNYVQNH